VAPDHDSVLGLVRNRDDDLAAIAEVARLGEVVERQGVKRAGVEHLQQAEHLHEHDSGPAGNRTGFGPVPTHR